MSTIEELILSKIKEFTVYSPYNFIRNIDQDTLTNETVIIPLLKKIKDSTLKTEEITVYNHAHYIIYNRLEWDTKYFGFPVYKIELILFNHTDLQIINSAINKFVDKFIDKGCYWFINVPCDDILLVQSLCSTPFRLVETRVNFYLENIKSFQSDRYSVRLADINDSAELKMVAIKMRNRFDRVHADPAFSTAQADAYLGTFIEESIKGFADYVLVPDLKGLKPFGFLACNKPVDILGVRISKLVLTAVDGSIQRGWLFRLLTEMIHRAKIEGADYMTTTTQAANKPSIHVWEKAGFHISAVTHIFSIKK